MRSHHELVLHGKTKHGEGYCKQHADENPFTVYDVDIHKSHWFGNPVANLSNFYRRRFENWIILERPQERIKVIYH